MDSPLIILAVCGVAYFAGSIIGSKLFKWVDSRKGGSNGN